MSLHSAPAANHPDLIALRQQIRNTLHVPETLPELRDKRYGQFNLSSTVDADRIAFNTAYRLRVPAIVYHQAGATIVRHPALIVVPNDGDNKASWYALAAGVMYANAGAVVLTYDPIGEFERNKDLRAGANQHEERIQPPELAARLTGLMVTDILQAASYLASRKDVDDQRIGVLAFSDGAFPASLACALNAGIAACVLAGGGDIWRSGSKKVCQTAAYQALSFLGDREAIILALTGKRLFKADWGGAARQPDFLNRAAAFWLKEKLKFPDWTRKQLAALPAFYTPDKNVAAVPRNQWRAVPDPLWKSEEENFVYESWLERARSASRDTL